MINKLICTSGLEKEVPLYKKAISVAKIEPNKAVYFVTNKHRLELTTHLDNLIVCNYKDFIQIQQYLDNESIVFINDIDKYLLTQFNIEGYSMEVGYGGLIDEDY